MKARNILKVLILVFAYSSASAAEQVVTIGTGNITGIYYPAGGAICRLLNKAHIAGLKCHVEPTSGSHHNLTAIRAGKMSVGIVQSDAQYYAYYGANSFANQGDFKDMRSLFSLHNDALTIVVRADSSIRSLADLKGKLLNIAPAGSGNRSIMDALLESQGWRSGDFKSVPDIKPAEQPEALCAGKIDAMIYHVGHPNGAVQEAANSCDISIIAIPDQTINQIVAKYPYYTPTVIPGGTYNDNPYDVKTVGSKATVVTSIALPEDVAYNLVKEVFDNFQTFKMLHPVFQNLEVIHMVKEGNTAPLHKGAEKYFKGKGLL
jgi:TRAP transporter TAXI family solute receptor